MPAFILFSPLLALLTLLVRVNLGAPVLFRQRYPDLHGNPFEMVEFHTMTDARDAQGVLLPDAERLTAFGKFLRSTSLDELLDTRHVLCCEASFPAPVIVRYNKVAESRHSLTANWCVQETSHDKYPEETRG